MEIIITKHAQLRLAERCGLNKKSMGRMARRAYESGIDIGSVKGAVRKWMEERHERNASVDCIKLYGDKAWLFSENRLVTVMQIPHDLLGKTQVFTKNAGRKYKRDAVPAFCDTPPVTVCLMDLRRRGGAWQTGAEWKRRGVRGEIERGTRAGRRILHSIIVSLHTLSGMTKFVTCRWRVSLGSTTVL